MVITKQQENDIRNIVKEVVQQCFADENLTVVFAEKISVQVTKNISEEFTKIKKDLAAIDSRINDLQGENEKLRTQNELLETKIIEIEKTLNKTTSDGENGRIFNKVMSLEQSNKSKQLRILGLPESNNNNLKEEVRNFIHTALAVEVNSIEFCTRLGQLQNEEKNRPVIVTFGNMHDRNEVFYNKKRLKNQKIIIREELTKFKYGIYKHARDKFGNKVWTKNGKIIIYTEGKKVIVNSIQEINEIYSKSQTPAASNI